MHGYSLAEAQARWDAEWAEWQTGVRPSYFTREEGVDDATLGFFREYHGDRPEEYEGGEVLFRTYDPADATWYQVFQTVSEGSPTTPPFATLEELTTYLADHGDGVDQFGTAYDGPTFGRPREPQPWGRARAEAFVGQGWAPSIVVTGGQILGPRDAALALSK
jgi:hypothetical protein